MIDATIAAFIFTALTGGVAVFQLALALGAPWGELAMGGKYPGRFPPHMRVGALVQMGLLILMAFVVLTRIGLVFNDYFELSKRAIWGVVAIWVVSAILNTITPSKKERLLGLRLPLCY